MSRVYFVAFVLLFSQVVNGQSGNAQLFQNLIPSGYVLLDTASGNLNHDAYNDLVLILKDTSEATNPDAARPLLLLTGTASGRYTLMARNDSVVLCKGCGGLFGDPYAGLVIRNGYFSIEHYGGSNWRWTRIITFKNDRNSNLFRLHRDAGVSFHTSDPGKEKTTLYRKEDFGKRLFTTYKYTDAL